MLLTMLPAEALAAEQKGTAEKLQHNGTTPLTNIGTENRNEYTVRADSVSSNVATEVIASGVWGDTLDWDLTEEETLTIRGAGYMWDSDVPGFLGGTSVTNRPPWEDSPDFDTLVIENGVASITSYAFCASSQLTTVFIPNSVTSIGDYAIYMCPYLESLEIPGSIFQIEKFAFGECWNLRSVKFH